MKKILVITALALGLSALHATAEEAAPGRVPPSVRCDKNGDGLLSRDEWPFSAELFAKLDKDGNGFIDSDESPGRCRGKRGKGGEGKGKGADGKGGQGRGKGAPGPGGRRQ